MAAGVPVLARTAVEEQRKRVNRPGPLAGSSHATRAALVALATAACGDLASQPDGAAVDFD